jgi:hypothetical protein
VRLTYERLTSVIPGGAWKRRISTINTWPPAREAPQCISPYHYHSEPFGLARDEKGSAWARSNNYTFSVIMGVLSRPALWKS